MNKIVSSHAHKQNMTERKVLEGLGYQFSVGHDGWTLYHNHEEVDSGRCYLKGEPAYMACIDAAVHRAIKHRNTFVEIIMPVAPVIQTEPTQAPIVEVVTLTKIQRGCIDAAIALLQRAGAMYRISAGGELIDTFPVVVPEQVKSTRIDHKSNYGPILHPCVGKGPFVVDVPVPDEIDLDKHRSVIANYLSWTYGKGTFTTEVNHETRMITVLVSDAPFKETP